MGYYINTGKNHDKARDIAAKFGGKIVAEPKSFADVPEDKGLIIVVNNYAFEAAAFVYNKEEFEAFTDVTDLRPKQFVLIPIADARKESGFSN